MPQSSNAQRPHTVCKVSPEFVQHGVITQESCHSDDFASRPDGPVVLPPMGTDKANARDEVGTSPVAVGLGWFLDALGFHQPHTHSPGQCG